MRPKREGQLIITGKPAVAIVAVIAAMLLWRLVVTHDTVAPELEQELRNVLAAEYAGTVLPDLEAAVEQRDHAKTDESVKRIKSVMENITFPSLKLRGGGRNTYVRAEILVDGQPPPKGKSIRYFRFSHSSFVGYVYNEEATVVDYYLPFMGD